MTKIVAILVTAIALIEKILVGLKIVKEFLDKVPGVSAVEIDEELADKIKKFEDM